MADVADGRSRQLTTGPVLATLVTSFDFTDDGKQIATVLVPDGRPPMPPMPAAPVGPPVKMADNGDKNRLRTFASLMTTPYEFESARVACHRPAGPDRRPARGPRRQGPSRCRRREEDRTPTMIRSLDPSPDGTLRARHAHGASRSPTSCRSATSARSTRSGTRPESRWRRLDRAAAQPRRAGRPPAPDPAAGGGRGGGQQPGKRELAWRADGQGLTYLEQEPAPPGRDGRPAARSAPAAARADARPRRRQPAAGPRPRPGGPAQGPPLPVAAAVRRRQAREGPLREQHAHERPPVLARHADALLPRNGTDRTPWSSPST